MLSTCLLCRIAQKGKKKTYRIQDEDISREETSATYRTMNYNNGQYYPQQPPPPYYPPQEQTVYVQAPQGAMQPQPGQTVVVNQAPSAPNYYQQPPNNTVVVVPQQPAYPPYNGGYSRPRGGMGLGMGIGAFATGAVVGAALETVMHPHHRHHRHHHHHHHGHHW